MTQAERSKRWRVAHPERQKAAQKKFREKHPDRCREATKRWSKSPQGKAKKAVTNQRYHATPKGKASVRKYALRRNYSLTPSQYDQLLQAQHNQCAICGNTPKQRLHVDHDHATGVVRGLLCADCNTKVDWHAKYALAASQYLAGRQWDNILSEQVNT